MWTAKRASVINRFVEGNFADDAKGLKTMIVVNVNLLHSHLSLAGCEGNGVRAFALQSSQLSSQPLPYPGKREVGAC
jgi:hypothetical protein